VTVLLFDFFGTLVRYSASRSSQGYPRTDALLRRLGMSMPYDDWLAGVERIRSRLLAAPSREGELEDHLREQVAVLTNAGLSGDEAFLVAVKRMGDVIAHRGPDGEGQHAEGGEQLVHAFQGSRRRSSDSPEPI
jgi:hypothetical protein